MSGIPGARQPRKPQRGAGTGRPGSGGYPPPLPGGTGPGCTGGLQRAQAGKPHPDLRGTPRSLPIPHSRPSRGSRTPALPHRGPTPTIRLPLEPGLSPPNLTPPSLPVEDTAPQPGPAPRTHPRPAGPAKPAGGRGGERSGAMRCGTVRCEQTRDSNPGTAPAPPGPTLYRIRRGRSQRAFRPTTVRASACRGGHGGAP